MRKINKWIGAIGLFLPSLMFAENGLDDGINMVASTGTLFGTIIVVVVVSLWLLPIAFAGLVYTGQKKKAEQMHEEVGLKAAIMALLSGVLGAAMSYYIVGTIGAYAKAGSGIDEVDLKVGNKYLLGAVIGKGVTKITENAEVNATP